MKKHLKSLVRRVLDEKFRVGLQPRKRISPNQLLWSILQDRRITAYRFERDGRLGAFRVGYYSKPAGLVIEVLGDSHGAPKSEISKRRELLEHHGVRLLQFPLEMVIERPESVKNTILEELPPR